MGIDMPQWAAQAATIARRAVILVLLALLAFAAHAELKVGERAPRSDTVLISGKVLPASQLENKVVVHYFWATWCPVCQGELPEIERLLKAYKPLGLEVIGVSLDNEKADVAEFLRERGHTIPVAMRTHAMRHGFGDILGTPTLFLSDRRGILRLKQLGTLPDGELETRIRSLLQ